MTRSCWLGLLAGAALSLSVVSVDARPARTPTQANKRAESPVDVAEAKTRWKRALDLYDEGNFDAARTELRRAYEIAPNYRLLYNLGQIEFELHDYPAALVDFQQFLAEGGAAIPADRKAEIERDIEKLRSRVASIEIVVDVAGADVAVDEITVGTSPLAKPLVVSAGNRVLTVTKGGFSPAKRVVDLAGGDTARIELHLAEIAATPVGAPANSQVGAPILAPTSFSTETAATSRSTAPLWISWGITGAFTAGAAVAGGLAFDASHALARERDTFGVSRTTLDSQQRKVSTLAAVADVAAGGALLAGIVSLYLSLAGRAPSRDERPGLPSVKVTTSLGSVGIEGAF
jgi:hypothetical protein